LKLRHRWEGWDDDGSLRFIAGGKEVLAEPDITVLALGYLGRANYVWWVWAGLLVVMNVMTYRQEQAPDYPMLPASRWPWAVLAAIIMALTFTISPFQQAWR